MLVAPTFFGYHRDIATELEARGYSVTHVTDRPSEGVAFKSVARLGYGLVQGAVDRHFRHVEAALRMGGYDLVLFVGGMSICFTRTQVAALREASDAAFGLYLWDALGNCQRVGGYTDLFDFAFSFEPGDCDGMTVRFLPLFYVRDYSELPAVPEGGFEYDACFVGSVHQVSKFEKVRGIVEALESGGARVFCHYYMPSRSSALLRKAARGAYRGVELQFAPLKRAEVARLYGRSRTVIDSPQGGQGGLTMRTIETLGARRRLITANAAARGYDFYRTGNVLVCAGGSGVDADFAMRDPEEVPHDVHKRYSISSWADQLLGAAE